MNDYERLAEEARVAALNVEALDSPDADLEDVIAECVERLQDVADAAEARA